MTPDEFLKFAKKNDAQMVDLKFVDMLGSWQHCSFPIDLWDEGTFKDGQFECTHNELTSGKPQATGTMTLKKE